MPLALAWGTFFWVAVGVVTALIAAFLLGGWDWVRSRIRDWRAKPKADPPAVDLDHLGERERRHVVALLHEREGYVRRRLKDRVEQVDEQIIKTRDDWLQRATNMRVALIDLGSELESARHTLGEASDRQSFWNPEQEQLPSARWEDHRQTLAGEPEVEDTRVLIDFAYQDCNRLNQRVRDRAEEGRREREQGIRRPAEWKTLDFDVVEGDPARVILTLANIDAATAAIAVSLEKL